MLIINISITTTDTFEILGKRGAKFENMHKPLNTNATKNMMIMIEEDGLREEKVNDLTYMSIRLS